MKGLDAKFMTGDIEKDEENSNMKQRAKILSFLTEENFLTEEDGEYRVDMRMFEDADFKQRLFKLYLGRKNGKVVYAGIARMRKLLGDLKIKTGQHSLNDMNNEEDNFVNFGEVFDKKFKKETPKERVISMLKKMGVIEEMDSNIIVDTERLQQRGPWVDKDIYICERRDCRMRFTAANIYKLLGDTKVISKKDYKEAILKDITPKTKPLFNIPDSVDIAFSIEDIKKKQYYLDIWDIYENPHLNKLKVPTREGKDIGGRELYLAKKIFKELQGQRDGKGVLKILNQDKNGFIKISNEGLIKAGIVNSTKSISKILLESCPNLLKSQILKLEDFEIKTNMYSGKVFRKEFTSPNPQKSFTAMMNTVQYYIGRKFFTHQGEKIPIENIKVVPLDGDNGGIIKMYEGREELIYTFKLLNDEEIQEKRDKIQQKYKGKLTEAQISARVTVGKKELTPRMEEYSPAAINTKQDDESIEAYGNRIANLPDYGYIQGVTKRFSEKTGVGMHNLRWREQLQVATMEYESGVFSRNEELNTFVDKYKLDGLRTFLSLEHGGLEMGNKILSIGEKLKEAPDLADKIFAKYAELVNVASEVESLLIEQLGNKETVIIRRVIENLLIKGKAILVMFADDKEIKAEYIRKKLRGIVTGVEVLESVLQEMKNAGETIDLSIIQKLNISSTYILDDEMNNKIGAMAQESWSQNVVENGVEQDFADIITKGLSNELSRESLDTETYIIKYENEPVGMIRFKSLANGNVEVKSVNVHPRLKGVNIGKFLFELISKRAEEKTLQLNVLLKNKVSCHYISQLGFQGYGYNDNMYDTDEPNIYTRRPKGRNAQQEKYIKRQEGDIEREFNITDPDGLGNMRDFLKEHLLLVDDQGNIIEGQEYNKKYTIIKQEQVKGYEDVRTVVLRKNNLM